MPVPNTIVLLPGLHGTSELLAPLAACLSVARPVETIDYPLNEALGYEDLLRLVLARLPEERFVILGESFAGPLAIEIAARMKDRVAGLILAAGFARYPIPRVLAFLARMADRRFIPFAVIKAMLIGRATRPGLDAALRAVLAKVPRHVIRARIEAIMRVDARRLLGETACPVLYLRGRLDRIIGREYLDEILRLRPDCHVESFDAPHMLLETHTEEAAAAIERFCAALPG